MSEHTNPQKGGRPISLEDAIKMTAKFKKDKVKVLKGGIDPGILPESETFDNSVFQKLMAQPGCVAIRAYFGMDDKDNINLILVGVNQDNEDILPSASALLSTAVAPEIYEYGTRCPPNCPRTSPLNPGS